MDDLDKEGLTGKLVDVIDKHHIGPKEITEKTREMSLGDYRKFYTSEEHEARRERILSTLLPGY